MRSISSEPLLRPPAVSTTPWALHRPRRWPAAAYQDAGTPRVDKLARGTSSCRLRVFAARSLVSAIRCETRCGAGAREPIDRFVSALVSLTARNVPQAASQGINHAELSSTPPCSTSAFQRGSRARDTPPAPLRFFHSRPPGGAQHRSLSNSPSRCQVPPSQRLLLALALKSRKQASARQPWRTSRRRT